MVLRLRLLAPLALTLLWAGCAGSPAEPRSRHARRSEPVAAPRAPASPLELSDTIFGVVTQLDRMVQAFLKVLEPVFGNAKKHQSLKEALASLGDIRQALKAHRKAYGRIHRPPHQAGRSLTLSFEG